MPKNSKPIDPANEPEDIDPEVREVMEDQTRLATGRGPNVAKEEQNKRALARAALRAIQAKDERAFSEALRHAGVKENSPEWKKAWEIYRTTSGGS